jgi:nucleotide-binding universal stress UspA family protein
MKKYPRAMGAIVFATDFLKPAQRAFAYAIALANALSMRLVILHVIKGMADAESPRGSDSRYMNPLKTAALLEVGRLARLAQDAGVRAEPLVQIGDPANCVMDLLPARQARLIVMGTHGRTGWDRLQLGSIAESVIRKAPCPVMTVRGVIAGELTRSHRHVRMTRLLVATDFSATAQAAVRYAAGLARYLEAALLVLHVVDQSAGGSEASRASQARRLRRTVSTLIEKTVTAEEACVVGVPIEVILDQAAKWQADVIAIGTQGRRGLHRLVLGSLAEQVVRRAGCPVVTLHRSAGHVRI